MEQCGGRRKILGGRKNNGDTRGKGIGFFGIDEEGASRSSLDAVLRGLIVGIRRILWFLSMFFYLRIWSTSENSDLQQLYLLNFEFIKV